MSRFSRRRFRRVLLLLGATLLAALATSGPALADSNGWMW
jgi:hypothetical protein